MHDVVERAEGSALDDDEAARRLGAAAEHADEVGVADVGEREGDRAEGGGGRRSGGVGGVVVLFGREQLGDNSLAAPAGLEGVAKAAGAEEGAELDVVRGDLGGARRRPCCRGSTSFWLLWMRRTRPGIEL